MLVDSKDILVGSDFLVLALRSNARLRKSKQWYRPCIYGWFRKGKCIYVGSSLRGINRFFDGDHRTSWSGVKPDDVIKFVWFERGITSTALRKIERALIAVNDPLLNLT